MSVASYWEQFLEFMKRLADDNLIAVFIPLSLFVFLCLIAWGAKFWVQSTSYLLGLKGIMILIFPELIMETWVDGGIDAMHILSARACGIVLIGQMLAYVLTKNTKDPTVQSSILWSRTMMTMVFLMQAVFALMDYKVKESKIAYNKYQLIVHNLVLVFGGCLYYSLKETEWGGNTEVNNNRRGTILRLDFSLKFLEGIMLFCLPFNPQTFNVKATALHRFLHRCVGACFISCAVTSGRACNFYGDDDKRGILLSNAVVQLLSAALMLAYTTLSSLIIPPYGYVFCVVHMVQAGIDLYGCGVPWLSELVWSGINPLIPRKAKEH